MATTKTVPAPKPAEVPEQIALASATEQVRLAERAQKDARATLEKIHALTTQQTEHTAASRVMAIQNIPGTNTGVFRTTEGTPPTPASTATRADIARARLARVGAEDAVIVAEADLLDAERALTAARQALAVRQLKDALPGLKADTERLLAEVETVAAKAAAFATERIRPLLEATPLAEAIRECELHELAMLADRAPRLRAMLAALTAQYLPSPNGDH